MDGSCLPRVRDLGRVARRRLLALLVAFCVGCAPPADGVESLQLRPGVRVVAAIDGPIGAPTVQDVARSGSTIVALVTSLVEIEAFRFAPFYWYFVSDDDGETWREVLPLPASVADELPWIPGDVARQSVPGGILFRDGVLYELTLASTSGLHVSRIDLTAATRRVVGRLDDARVAESGGLVHGYQYSTSLVSARSYDVRTAELVRADYVDPMIAQQHCWPAWALRGPDEAPRFVGSCQNDFGRCYGRADLAESVVAEFICVGTEEWPTPQPDGAYDVAVPEGWLSTTDRETASARTRLVTLSGTREAPVLRTIAVGPGDVTDVERHDDGGLRARERFGGFVPLVEPLEDTRTHTTVYRRAASDRFRATSLPTRPCVDGGHCGYRLWDPLRVRLRDSTLQWIEPLDGADVLMFYAVDSMRPSTGLTQPVLLVSRERLAPQSAERSGELERACALAESCFPESVRLEDCVSIWLDTSRADRVGELTAARDCAAVARLFPASAHLGQPCTGDVLCRDEVALYCVDGTVTGVGLDCNQGSGTCTVDSASGSASCVTEGDGCPATTGTCDASGRLVTCGERGVVDCAASGAACRVAEGFAACAIPVSACAAAFATACDGDVAVSCTEPGFGAPTSDCSLLPGFTCGVHGCGAMDADCTDATRRCEGTRLRYCVLGSTREIDCAELGLTCTAAGGEARCS